MISPEYRERRTFYYAHPTALIESEQIGACSRIWAFCHVLHGAIIGRNCNVGDHCYIEEGAQVGNDVVIKNNVAIWHGVTIEDRVFIGPNVAFTNDTVPRARVYRDDYDRTLIRVGASLGANATILCGITIGRYALIGAGAVVTRDVPDFGLVTGNPARLRKFVCKCGKELAFSEDVGLCGCGQRYRREGVQVQESE